MAKKLQKQEAAKPSVPRMGQAALFVKYTPPD